LEQDFFSIARKNSFGEKKNPCGKEIKNIFVSYQEKFFSTSTVATFGDLANCFTLG